MNLAHHFSSEILRASFVVFLRTCSAKLQGSTGTLGDPTTLLVGPTSYVLWNISLRSETPSCGCFEILSEMFHLWWNDVKCRSKSVAIAAMLWYHGSWWYLCFWNFVTQQVQAHLHLFVVMLITSLRPPLTSDCEREHFHLSQLVCCQRLSCPRGSIVKNHTPIQHSVNPKPNLHQASH